MIFFIFLALAANARVTTKSVSFSKSGVRWVYLDKFAMGIGTGYWKIRARFEKSRDGRSKESLPVKLNMYMDDNWETALDYDTCSSKVSTSKRERIIEVPKNGQWSAVYDGALS